MVIDFQKLWKAFVDLGITGKKLEEMNKEEIESLCRAANWCSVIEEGDVDRVPF